MVQICVHPQMLVDSTWTPAPKVGCLDPFQQLLIAMITNCFHLVGANLCPSVDVEAAMKREGI